MNMEKTKIDWETLDTICIYMPTELLAYHLFLLEEAKKCGKIKQQEKEETIICNLIKTRNMEEQQCLKR